MCIPDDWDADFRKCLTNCWSGKPEDRPTMKDVVDELRRIYEKIPNESSEKLHEYVTEQNSYDDAGHYREGASKLYSSDSSDIVKEGLGELTIDEKGGYREGANKLNSSDSSDNVKEELGEQTIDEKEQCREGANNVLDSDNDDNRVDNDNCNEDDTEIYTLMDDED